MSEQAHIQTLFAYHWDTTDRLIASAGKLSAPESDALKEILFHLLRVDYAWRTALETGKQPQPLDAADFPTLDSISAGFAAERRAWDAMLAGLGDEAIGAEVALTRYNGQSSPLPRWRVLHQVLLHGMQHHAELAQLLTEQGQSPGNIDFIFYK